jgi:hypothetical protein
MAKSPAEIDPALGELDELARKILETGTPEAKRALVRILRQFAKDAAARVKELEAESGQE